MKKLIGMKEIELLFMKLTMIYIMILALQKIMEIHQVMVELAEIPAVVEAEEVAVIVGKIDYLNLLPFHLFIKKYNIKTKKGYPAQVNRLFEKRIVDAAFISSIKSKNRKCFDAGIIANKKVMSVLVCEGQTKDDFDLLASGFYPLRLQIATIIELKKTAHHLASF
jgi:hypothetical protein